MNYRRFIKWWVLALILLAAAAVPLFLQSRSPNAGPDLATTKLKVDRYSLGGIAGDGDGANLSIHDSQIVMNARTRSLSEVHLRTIASKLTKANFFDLNDRYECEGCADQFATILTVAYDGREKKIVFEEGSDAPAALTDLDRYLISIAP